MGELIMIKTKRIDEPYRYGFLFEFDSGYSFELLRVETIEGNRARWEIFGMFKGSIMFGEFVERYDGTWNGCAKARKAIADHQRSFKESGKDNHVCDDNCRSNGCRSRT